MQVPQIINTVQRVGLASNLPRHREFFYCHTTRAVCSTMYESTLGGVYRSVLIAGKDGTCTKLPPAALTAAVQIMRVQSFKRSPKPPCLIKNRDHQAVLDMLRKTINNNVLLGTLLKPSTLIQQYLCELDQDERSQRAKPARAKRCFLSCPHARVCTKRGGKFSNQWPPNG